MKLEILTAALCLLASGGFAADRVFSEQWDVKNGYDEPMELTWFQGESIDYAHRARRGSTPVDLTQTNQVIVWEVLGEAGTTDYTNAYMVITGVVQSSAGLVEFEATPAEANLEPGTYAGYVRSMRSTDTTLEHVAVLAYQEITVKWGPDGRFYDVIGPLTYPALYTEANWQTITNDFQTLETAFGVVSNDFQTLETAFDVVSNDFQTLETYVNEQVDNFQSPTNGITWADATATFATTTDLATTSNTLAAIDGIGLVERRSADGSTEVYAPSADTDIARGSMLQTAFADMVDGDTLALSTAVYDIGANAYTSDNSLGAPLSNVSFIGVGSPVILASDGVAGTQYIGIDLSLCTNVLWRGIDVRLSCTNDYPGSGVYNYAFIVSGVQTGRVEDCTILQDLSGVGHLGDKTFVAVGDASDITLRRVNICTPDAHEASNTTYHIALHDMGGNVVFDSCGFYGNPDHFDVAWDSPMRFVGDNRSNEKFDDGFCGNPAAIKMVSRDQAASRWIAGTGDLLTSNMCLSVSGDTIPSEFPQDENIIFVGPDLDDVYGVSGQNVTAAIIPRTNWSGTIYLLDGWDMGKTSADQSKLTHGNGCSYHFVSLDQSWRSTGGAINNVGLLFYKMTDCYIKISGLRLTPLVSGSVVFPLQLHTSTNSTLFADGCRFDLDYGSSKCNPVSAISCVSSYAYANNCDILTYGVDVSHGTAYNDYYTNCRIWTNSTWLSKYDYIRND